MKPQIKFKRPDVEEAAHLITERFDHSNAFKYPTRFALAVGQRVCFRQVKLEPPSLDVGVNDGSTAAIIHYGKPRITWGGDMPEESTYESMGLYVHPEYAVYDNLVGFDVSTDVPFPDNSFNSICCTEVFSYGIDRDRALAELARVLAPGGTLAFSDTAEDIRNFEHLWNGLREYVSSLDVLADSRAYYSAKLRPLGLADVTTRLYLGRCLAAPLHALMYSADPSTDHERHRQRLVEDERLRGLYVDGLFGIASALDEEFSRSDGPSDGWHVFVVARKPGELDTSRGTPTPRCPVCASADLEFERRATRCTNCGRDYTTRYGVPYLLRHAQAAFSPKRARPAHLDTDIPVDAHIAAVVDASTAQPRRANALDVYLYGVDPSTPFTIRCLQKGDVRVNAVVTSDARAVGRSVADVRVIDLAEAPRDATIIMSAFPGVEESALEELAAMGHRGTTLSLVRSTGGGWKPIPIEGSRRQVIEKALKLVRARLRRVLRPGCR